MKADKVRSEFLHFFEKHATYKHTKILSSSLVPANDTSVLFTTAGMQQFKPYFLNNKDLAEKDLGSHLFTSTQKCFRVSDIDEIGDASHLTFFEMLGNFSIGGYFKKEAIELAWEFITKRLSLNPDLVWVTYFKGDSEKDIPEDTETKKIWIEIGVQKNHIIGRGAEDNFWGPPGATGPCGPATEIYYPIKNVAIDSFNESILLEIWNIVLMEYQKTSLNEYETLEQKNIDTGMGLERIAMITEGVTSVFETSFFSKSISVLKQDEDFGFDLSDTKRLFIALDHIRASVFLLADDITFGKKEQRAVLRRIFRKFLDQYRNRRPKLEAIVESILQTYKHTYPELGKKKKMVLEQMYQEQHMYLEVRERKVDEYIKKVRHHKFVTSQVEPLRGPSHRELLPDEAFALFATYGFTLEQLLDEGYSFDKNAVKKKIEQHKEKSKSGSEKKFGGHGLDTIHDKSMPEDQRIEITKLHTATHLLHAALRKILGPTVKQQGSDISPERLRFDFSYEKKLTDEEKNKVEELVNAAILANYSVVKETMSYKDAVKNGALAFFREKYPETVSVYTVKNPQTNEVFSMELCGGPHVAHTEELGGFAISSEKSIAKGVRRIKAVLTEDSRLYCTTL